MFWFEKYFLSIQGDLNYVSKGVNDFIQDINNSSDFSRLAENPLLLGILITQRLKGGILPTNINKALESIIDYLISIHPQIRATAANVVNSESFNFDLIDIFESLALHIQTEAHQGVIDKLDAQRIIESFLIQYLDKPKPIAKKISRNILDIGANNYGIIIEKNSQEIAFSHRLFQEFLSARNLQNSEDEDQVILAEYGGHPSWNYVFRFYFGFFSTRKERTFRKALELLGRENQDEEYKLYVQFLRYEVILTLNNSPINIVNQYLPKLFNDFEQETNEDVKLIYLQILLKALQNSKIKEEIQEFLFTYFPQ